MPYKIDFAESTREQLDGLSARERSRLFDALEKYLVHEPLVQTRKRKLLRPNPVAPWELRVGELRAFYEVVSEESNTVRILAIGRKVGNQLFISGKAIKL